MILLEPYLLQSRARMTQTDMAVARQNSLVILLLLMMDLHYCRFLNVMLVFFEICFKLKLHIILWIIVCLEGSNKFKIVHLSSFSGCLRAVFQVKIFVQNT